MIRLVISVLCSSFVVVCCVAVYSEDDRERMRAQSQEAQQQQVQQQIQAQQARPILPPVVPIGPSMVSPTPSPHITAPQINNPVMTIQPPVSPQPPLPQPVMQNIPSAPAYPPVPSAPIMPLELSQVPIMGNAIGKVMNKGSEKDGSLWLEVNDNLFDQLVKVKIKNLKNTPIVRQAQIYKFSDINIGDTVNAMYHTENDDNVANFINVMTEEEIEMWNQAPDQGLTVTPKESEGSNKTPVPIENNTQHQEK